VGVYFAAAGFISTRPEYSDHLGCDIASLGEWLPVLKDHSTFIFKGQAIPEDYWTF